MSDKNTQAFPTEQYATKSMLGMTLRDYFAAKAMQGAIASLAADQSIDVGINAVWAYKVADAMLEVRSAK